MVVEMVVSASAAVAEAVVVENSIPVEPWVETVAGVQARRPPGVEQLRSARHAIYYYTSLPFSLSPSLFPIRENSIR